MGNVDVSMTTRKRDAKHVAKTMQSSILVLELGKRAKVTWLILLRRR